MAPAIKEQSSCYQSSGLPQSGGLHGDKFVPFANRPNSHCPHWFSLMSWVDPSFGVDAFTHVPWPLYTIPLLHLIHFPLDRVRQEQLLLILAALDCCLALWYAKMTCTLAAQPWTDFQFMGAQSQEGAISSLPILGQPHWSGP